MGGAPDVLLDACKRGDGLWFDGGELTRALKEMTSGKPQSDVLSFLSEVFPAEAKTANGKS